MRTASYQRPMSVLLNWFKLVDGPFGQNIFRANNFCPDQPGRNRKYVPACLAINLNFSFLKPNYVLEHC